MKINNKLNVLIMPTDECNMNCVYCFHHKYHHGCQKMTIETLTKLYDIVFKSYDNVAFVWHGGEPLIMGLDFYKKAIELQKKYNAKIENRMQSNITLLDNGMTQFLCENNIEIGTSFDGSLNYMTRGKSNIILDKRKMILQHGGSCGIIMVVSSININNLVESYILFKKMRANYTINFYVPSKNTNNDKLILNPYLTINKMIELYDYWIKDTEGTISIGYFERIISFIMSGKKTVCKYNSCIGKWIGVRYNGDITPCNRYFPEKYNYGNISEYDDICQAFNSEGFKRLLKDAIIRRNKCKNCSIYDFCSGGCNNVAYNENDVTENNGPTCIITRSIYDYIYNSIQYILKNKIDVNPVVWRIIKKYKHKN